MAICQTRLHACSRALANTDTVAYIRVRCRLTKYFKLTTSPNTPGRVPPKRRFRYFQLCLSVCVNSASHVLSVCGLASVDGNKSPSLSARGAYSYPLFPDHVLAGVATHLGREHPADLRTKPLLMRAKILMFDIVNTGRRVIGLWPSFAYTAVRTSQRQACCISLASSRSMNPSARAPRWALLQTCSCLKQIS